MKTYDLDSILISREAYDGWIRKITETMPKIMDTYPDLRKSEIPDEQFMVFPDGSAQIYVQIRDLRVALTLKKTDYEYRGKN